MFNLITLLVLFTCIFSFVLGGGGGVQQDHGGSSLKASSDAATQFTIQVNMEVLPNQTVFEHSGAAVEEQGQRLVSAISSAGGTLLQLDLTKEFEYGTITFVLGSGNQIHGSVKTKFIVLINMEVLPNQTVLEHSVEAMQKHVQLFVLPTISSSGTLPQFDLTGKFEYGTITFRAPSPSQEPKDVDMCNVNSLSFGFFWWNGFVSAAMTAIVVVFVEYACVYCWYHQYRRQQATRALCSS